jgi:hypothetical protein
MPAAPARNAARVRLHRERKRAGEAVLSVPVPFVEWSEYLIERAGLLAPDMVEDRAAVEDATAKFLRRVLEEADGV